MGQMINKLKLKFYLVNFETEMENYATTKILLVFKHMESDHSSPLLCKFLLPASLLCLPLPGVNYAALLTSVRFS